MSLNESFDDVEPPVTNRADIKRKEKTKNVDEKRRRATLKGLMTVAEGRELIGWLMEKCHFDKTSTCVNPSGFDAYGTFFNEGARSVGILLHTEIVAAAPAEYALMLEEERDRKELRKQGNG